MTAKTDTQIDLFEWAKELEEERERVAGINAASARRDAATSSSPPIPIVGPDEPGYREVFATEARTPNQAMAKVRPIADGRRLRAYLVTGAVSRRASRGSLGRIGVIGSARLAAHARDGAGTADTARDRADDIRPLVTHHT